MTDECSQRQYGRSVYRHCKDKFVHSESGNAFYNGSVNSDSFPTDFLGGFLEINMEFGTN